MAALAVAVLAPPAAARAQGPPINAQNAFVTGLNGAAFRTFFVAMERGGLRLDGREVADHLDRRFRVRGQVFVLPYELLANRLVVMAAVPYLEKSLEARLPGGRQRLTARGFGDLAIVAKLGVLQLDRPNRTTRAALFGRLKLPTGDDDATGPGGGSLPRSLQLGTGSVDASAGVILTHSVGPLGLSGDLIYDLNTSSEGFEYGDALRYDLALGYRVHPRIYRAYPERQVNLYLEVNGTWRGRHRSGGAVVADSGGQVVLLSPGIQFIPLANFLVETTYQIPVWQRLNGAQLGYRPALKVGLRWLLF